MAPRRANEVQGLGASSVRLCRDLCGALGSQICSQLFNILGVYSRVFGLKSAGLQSSEDARAVVWLQAQGLDPRRLTSELRGLYAPFSVFQLCTLGIPKVRELSMF